MKKVLFAMLAVSFLLVGCGKTEELDPATPPPWVSHFKQGTPTFYYVSTGEAVQTVGKLIISFSPTPQNKGLSGWGTNDLNIQTIQVYAIPGIDVSRAVAVKFAKDGPFIKAVAESKQP